MLFPIDFQLRLFIFSIIAGFLTGTLFDIYRLIRGVSHPGNIVTIIQDTLFWIFTSILVFIFLLYTNYAYVSIYIYILIFIGILVYLKFLSDLCILILYNLNKFLFKSIRIFIKHLMFPVSILIYKLKKSFKN
ncbi:spore cortex biosynthesis protein YabQ [Hathewaya histolytica]|uniref:spore cortex biosynthesis protein YabQ n=1 Tax=Hathewaya histolytica TaxID=1498 RepID=UPI003B683E29